MAESFFFQIPTDFSLTSRSPLCITMAFLLPPQKKALDSQVSAVTLLGKSLICLQLRAIFPTRMLHQRSPSLGDPERAATICRGLMATVVPLSAAWRRWGKSPMCGAGLGTWQ